MSGEAGKVCGCGKEYAGQRLTVYSRYTVNQYVFFIPVIILLYVLCGKDMIEQTGTTGTPETEKKYQPSGWLNNYARLPASPCNQRFLPSYFSGCPLGTAGSGRSLGVPSNRSGSDHLRIDTTAIVSHRKCSHPVEKYCRCCACTFFSFSRNTDIMIICTVLMFQATRQLRQKH